MFEKFNGAGGPGRKRVQFWQPEPPAKKSFLVRYGRTVLSSHPSQLDTKRKEQGLHSKEGGERGSPGGERRKPSLAIAPVGDERKGRRIRTNLDSLLPPTRAR